MTTSHANRTGEPAQSPAQTLSTTERLDALVDLFIDLIIDDFIRKYQSGQIDVEFLRKKASEGKEVA